MTPPGSPANRSNGARTPTDVALRVLHRWWRPAVAEEPAHEGPRLNRRLTGVTGLALIPPVVVVVATGALFDPLWRPHYFVGILLLPLAALKLGATGYRAARYYLRNRGFREAGPPHLPMRLLAPVLVVSLLVVAVTGVQMWLVHTQGQPWSTLHSAAAVVFTAAVAAHLVFYLPQALSSARAEAAPSASRGRMTRRTLLAASLAFGLVAAAAVTVTADFPTRQHDVTSGSAGPPPAER